MPLRDGKSTGREPPSGRRAARRSWPLLLVALAGVQLLGGQGLAAGGRESATAGAAARYIEGFSTRAVAILSDPTLSAERRDDSFRRLLLLAFDIRDGARFALGHGWRNATDRQREEYVRLFQKDLLRTGRRLFEGFEGEYLIVERVIPWGEGHLFVESKLSDPEARIDDVDFHLGIAGGGFRIIDVRLEGLSVLGAYRSEFVDWLFRGGIEKVIALLRERNGESGS